MKQLLTLILTLGVVYIAQAQFTEDLSGTLNTTDKVNIKSGRLNVFRDSDNWGIIYSKHFDSPANQSLHLNYYGTGPTIIGTGGGDLYVQNNAIFNGNILIKNNQFIRGERSGGGVSNLIGYNPVESGNHILAFSEYSSVPSEVRIYTPTDQNQGVSIYSDKRLVFFRNDGNVGIGVDSPNNKLSVNGTIWAKEVKVSMTDAADWVFEDGYELKSLDEVEKFVRLNKHLPDLPSADEFRENDLNVADMDNKLLQKIEELTLYMIDMNKRMNQLEIENSELKGKVQLLENK
ncbi:hypothetical protein [Marinoscillum sp. 108]|uniref:hypothetical protein n=1 Tax=Marinoscillum sp. 108 TaxID=2653151 RepID=UPI0012F0A350|nr:hypothetical protein [Marinoscillum sp. 108]VXD10884.1 exported hypothetical protein [Marinoscillum sp. 108]